MNKLFVFAAAALLLAACSGTPEPESSFQPNPLDPGPDVKSEETPIDERIASLLQESKQQYDEGHIEMAWKMAQQVHGLIVEHKFPVEDEVMALTIEGYCLLALGRIDDYYVTTHGIQEGAISKFQNALKFREEDFRCKLGIGLAKFRRHADSIIKAESLGEGVILLESVREDFKRGLGKDGRPRLKEANRKLELFNGNREALIKLGYIFRDPRTVPLDDKTGAEPKWLGGLSEADSTLAVNDLLFVITDAVEGKEVSSEDRKAFDANAKALADAWRNVRSYWRLQGLTDLQACRDALLAVREMDKKIAEDTGRMVYFWVDRDLTFVFQSLGAFFLDSGLEKARLQAISEGVGADQLEARAKAIYLDDKYDTADKRNSKANYQAALDYTESFVKKHEEFEKLRLLKSDEAEPDKDNSNPFMVDLVRRYQQTMLELVAEEKAVRTRMVLEATVLCVEPLFQISDITEANVWANKLKSMNPDDPIHHFVRATAYFYTDDFETAKSEYEAFMERSSLTDDANRRSIARMRIMQCDQHISRKAGAGE
jgi:hypothetical protein